MAVRSGGRSEARLRAVLLVAILAAAVSSPAMGAKAAKTRTVSQVYLALTGTTVDCETLYGGACFPLQGDEIEAGITVVDDSGLRPTSGRYEFRAADGTVLGTSAFCESTAVAVPEGAESLAVMVAAFDVLACQGPATGSTGLVRVVTKVSDGAFEAYHAEEQLCLQATPRTISAGGVTEPDDTGQRITLDAYVLLDGVDPERGRQIMELAAQTYQPEGIDLRSHFKPVALPAADNGQLMMSHAMEFVGGQVPDGFDLVHVLTSRSLNVGGQASCIGGIAYGDRAFSVSQAGPTRSVVSAAGIAAHEMGHTLGGHHHYGNCVEGFTRDRQACTIMVSGGVPPSTFAWEFRFSSLNAAIVRGHAVQFVTP